MRQKRTQSKARNPYFLKIGAYLKENQRMADRKQFLSVPQANPKLRALLADAKKTKVSEEQLKEQRISFAFGNAPDSELITKDSVRRSSNQIRLK